MRCEAALQQPNLRQGAHGSVESGDGLAAVGICQRDHQAIREIRAAMLEQLQRLDCGCSGLPSQRGVVDQGAQRACDGLAGEGIAAAQHPGEFRQHHVADEQVAIAVSMGLDQFTSALCLRLVVAQHEPQEYVGVERDHRRPLRLVAEVLDLLRLRPPSSARCRPTASFICSTVLAGRWGSCSRPNRSAAPAAQWPHAQGAIGLKNGRQRSYLRGRDWQAIQINGLWGLAFGNGASLGRANYLYFTDGPNGEADGLFGSLHFVDE